MREAEISRLESVNGAELVRLKGAMERSFKSKESFLKLGKSMSDEEREKVTAKLNEEENQTKEKIKEKEEELIEETKKFREPLERRLQETLKIENSITEAFDFIKTKESNLNKQIKECESFIKEAQQLDLLGGVGGDVVKIFESKKIALDVKAKEIVEKKTLLSLKLDVLKDNKKEIETALKRVNNIGKTKQEIEEEGKDKKKDGTKTKSMENKKSGTEFSYTKKDKDEAEDEGETEIKDNKKVSGEILTKEKIAEIVMKELKSLGITGITDKTMREQITNNVIIAVETMIAKSKKTLGEKEIKKEVGDWYRKYSKNYFKKYKQS